MTTVEREAATSPEGAVEDSRPDRAESRYGPYVRRLLLAALVIALCALFWAGRDVVLAAFAGCLVALLLDRFARQIRRVAPLLRKPSILLALVVIVLLGAAVMVLFGTQIAGQFDSFVDRAPDALARARDLLGHLGMENALPSLGAGGSTDTDSAAPEAGSLLRDSATLLTGGLNSILLGLAILITGVFLVLDVESYRNGLLRLVPIDARPRAEQVLRTCAETLGDWLGAKLLIMAVFGIAVGAGNWLIGVPLAPLLGLIAGLFEFVPVVGPIAAAIPAILLGLTIDLQTAGLVTLLYFAVSQVEGLLLIPLVQEQAVELPAALTLLATILFGTLFGLLGVFLAVPLLIVTMVAVRMLYVEDVLERGRTDPG